MSANKEIVQTGGGLILLNDTQELVQKDIVEMRSKVFSSMPGFCSVHFTNIAKTICGYIEKASAVTGCVAWFTNPEILEKLAEIPSRIAIQREDFMRYEKKNNETFYQAKYRKEQLERLTRMKTIPLADLYKNDPLPIPTETRPEFQDLSVRCVGHLEGPGGDKKGRCLMHHKFLVFYNYNQRTNRLEPFAVITGSANLSMNMSASIENIVYIEDSEVALRYHQEFMFVYGLSVPVLMVDDNPGNKPCSTFQFDCSTIPRRSSYFGQA